ncbi:bifunctional glycosyltransferase/CDP-glycerol:glycerophosphate glycerophosphotransferase [Bacillus kwashiorkori]|uniref:bifunctional glycosyltransferase/CDP-glycerol:glycerophosphate glycerophosphotransferase n=1 Tax=Bacillus kwashiorkori TaxID=1522318 RepID=UPI000783126A|nr:CDP-glycerol glycerophosphotransferase family protein [Bacillus kwashiorkori]
MADITVIIPAYNASNLIIDTLDSVKNQTFKGNIEIICIDDASDDDTVQTIKEYQKQTKLNLQVLLQEENQRQGAARNRGLKEATGKYIFFLDSDDFLDENTLQALYDKAEQKGADFVLCDWTYYYTDRGEVYVNNDLFLFDEWLEGEDCERLLQAESYFTVNKLYNRSFLIDNNISYGEGYIYEDLEFYVAVAQHANLIGIVSNPYYKVRVNPNSTTKTQFTTTLHMDDYLQALEATLRTFKPRREDSTYMLYKYLFYRALLYSEKRIPRPYRKEMIAKTVKLLNEYNQNFYVPKNIVLFNRLYFRKGLIRDNKINLIMFIRYLHRKGKLNRYFNLYSKTKRLLSIRSYIEKFKKSKWNQKRRRLQIRALKQKYMKQPVQHNAILFLGFDYRYSGNSKYLFDYLINNHPSTFQIKFVTNNEAVPQEYRVKPRTQEFWKALNDAKFVITESWTPLDFFKKEDAIWIQLWHGTPYKRLFFDSHEKMISQFNRNHKRNKKRDISRWDYLLADSNGGKEKLKSAFSYPAEQILAYGYPRVQWLKDNFKNEELKQTFKRKLNIDENKKIVFYAPTWRDYNYKTNLPDLSYLIDLKKLVEKLGDDYVVIAKMHSMEREKLSLNKVIIPPDEMETQELLLITDILLSDYSSIFFDVLPLNMDFYLYVNDRDRYEEVRGVYRDMEKLLEPFTFNDEEELIKHIKEGTSLVHHPNYVKLNEEFGNSYHWNSNEQLVKLFVNISQS